MTDTVRSKKQIPPQQFVEAAQYMVILIGDEHEKLFNLEQQVAQMKRDLLEKHEKVNKVNILVQASDTYKEMRKQKALISQIEEAIRIAKLMGRMRDTELKLN